MREYMRKDKNIYSIREIRRRNSIKKGGRVCCLSLDFYFLNIKIK